MPQKDIVNDLLNQRKQLLDNALDGVILSEDDKEYLTYLIKRCDLYELQRMCNLFIKVRLQGNKQ